MPTDKINTKPTVEVEDLLNLLQKLKTARKNLRETTINLRKLEEELKYTEKLTKYELSVLSRKELTNTKIKDQELELAVLIEQNQELKKVRELVELAKESKENADDALHNLKDQRDIFLAILEEEREERKLLNTNIITGTFSGSNVSSPVSNPNQTQTVVKPTKTKPVSEI